MTDSDFVLVDVVDHVGWLTLNEPARLNPVTLSRIAAINRAAQKLSARDDVHIIVVTGMGRGFCSGADQKDQEILSAPIYAPGNGSLSDATGGVWTLSAVRQPVIAMVNGAAIGYGFELAAQADIVFAGASAKFSLPFAKLGTVTDTGAATWLLPRQIGRAAAADLLFTGRLISADEALALGVAYRVFPDDQLRAATTAVAAEIAQGHPPAVRALKQMLVHGQGHDAASHLLLQFEQFNRHRPMPHDQRADATQGAQ